MNTVRLSGELIFARSADLLPLLDQALQGGQLTLDFQAVTTVDSSAVALLLAWLRRAQAVQCQLHCQQLPASLQQLLAVYGLSHLFRPA